MSENENNKKSAFKTIFLATLAGFLTSIILYLTIIGVSKLLEPDQPIPTQPTQSQTLPTPPADSQLQQLKQLEQGLQDLNKEMENFKEDFQNLNILLRKALTREVQKQQEAEKAIDPLLQELKEIQQLNQNLQQIKQNFEEVKELNQQLKEFRQNLESESKKLETELQKETECQLEGLESKLEYEEDH